MLKSKRLYHRNKGFTLIEILLVIVISSMILLPIFSLLNLTIKSCIATEEKDELILNANFAIDFIKFEVKSADLIIDSSEIEGLNTKYPNNLGFVIINHDVIKNGDSKYILHNYITYYFNENSMIRIACEDTKTKYPDASSFAGYNSICDFLYSIKGSKYNREKSIITLDFTFKNHCEFNLKSDIYIRSEVSHELSGGLQ